MSNWAEIDEKLTTPSFFATGGYFDLFRILRTEDPVHWTDGKAARPFWSVTRHADCVRVLKDPYTFSSRLGSVIPSTAEPLSPELRHKMGFGAFPTHTDPPDHMRVRRAFNPHWTHGAIARMNDTIQSCVDEILNEVEDLGSCDFVEDIAAKLPVRLVCDLMGVPLEDRPMMRQWCSTVLEPSARARETEQSPAYVQVEIMEQLYDYMGRLAKRRQSEPADDFTTIAVQLEAEGEKLAERDLIWWCVAFVVAGLESTRNAMSVAMLTFLENPDQMDRLRKDPSLSGTAAEEIVRWVNPAKYRFRIAAKDCELGGKQIRAGDWVMAWIASANRDENVFKDPDKFDITRFPNPHLAYGVGEHSCIGRNLAKREIEIMFNSVLARLTNLRVSGAFEWLGSDNHTALKSLPLTFDKARCDA